MKQKLNITKIVLTPSGGQDVALTIDEARDLYNQLAELFAPKLLQSAPVVIERHVWPAPWQPYRPTWLSSPSSADYPINLPYVTCQADSGLKTRFMGTLANDTGQRLTPVGAGDGNTFVVG